MTTQQQNDLQPPTTEQAASDFMWAENLRLGETPRGWPIDASDLGAEAGNWSRVESNFPGTDHPAVKEPLDEPEQRAAPSWPIITAAALALCAGVLLGIQI